MQFVMNLGARLLFERPAKRKDFDQLADMLQTNGEKIVGRVKQSGKSDRAREALVHLIGIERWGQRRLMVALGEPFIRDEYDDYRPDDVDEWRGLRDAFEATRGHTVELAAALADAEFNGTIEHNAFGELTPRGWLKYLDFHANTTAYLVR
jgi:hypothetical protein